MRCIELVLWLFYSILLAIEKQKMDFRTQEIVPDLNWNTNILKFNSGLYTPIQMTKYWFFMSNKLTRYSLHKKFLENNLDHSSIPTGMLHKLPVTIGKEDFNLLKKIRLKDYSNSLEETYIYLNWYKDNIIRIRAELFKVRNKIKYNLPRQDFKFLDSGVYKRYLKDKNTIENTHKGKLKRDIKFNLDFRKKYDISDNIFQEMYIKCSTSFSNICQGDTLEDTGESLCNKTLDTSITVLNDNIETEDQLSGVEVNKESTISVYNHNNFSGINSNVVCSDEIKIAFLKDINDENTETDETNNIVVENQTVEVFNCDNADLLEEANVVNNETDLVNNDLVKDKSDMVYENFYPVNLSKEPMDRELQELCALGKSFVVTSPNINRVQLQEGFERWVLRLRRTAYFATFKKFKPKVLTEKERILKDLEQKFVKSDYEPPDDFHNDALELYIKKVKEEIFNPKNLKRVYPNISNGQKNAIKKCKEDKEHIIRLQDKGGLFTYNKTSAYIENMEGTILDPQRFKILPEDPTENYIQRISSWADRYLTKRELSDKLVDWIGISEAAPGAIYGLDKTHKNPPTIRTITSSCGAANENLASFVSYYLKPIAEKLPFVIKDTYDFLRLLNNVNENIKLPKELKLVTIDIINMFPSIKNEKGIAAVKPFLNNREINFPSSECILEALTICLESNCSQFGDKFITQSDGAATGPRYVPDYADIFLLDHDLKITRFDPEKLIFYGRYRDDCFVLWGGGDDSLNQFFVYINSIDPDIQFTIKSSDHSIEFLDVLVFVENGKLETTVYSKPTDGHVYLHPKSNHPRHQINAIPKSQALRLRKIISKETDYQIASVTYSQYFIDRGYSRSLVEKAFKEVSKLDRSELLINTHSGRPKKQGRSVYPLVIEYNPKLPSINKVLKENMNILHTDENMRNLFPIESIFWAAKRGKNLKEILAPSRFKGTRLENDNQGCFNTDNHCDLCKYLVTTDIITSFSTGEKFKIKNILNCNSKNVIYCIIDLNCKLQNVGSTLDMKSRFSAYKYHIKKNLKSSNLYIHWNNSEIEKPHPCTHPVPQSKNDYDIGLRKEMEVVILEEVRILPNDTKKVVINKLRQREVIWQNKLNTWVPHGLNKRNEGFTLTKK